MVERTVFTRTVFTVIFPLADVTEMLILHVPALRDSTPLVEVLQNRADDEKTRTLTLEVDDIDIFAILANVLRVLTSPTAMLVVNRGFGVGFQYGIGGDHVAGVTEVGTFQEIGGTGAFCGGFGVDPDGGSTHGPRTSDDELPLNPR